MARWAYRGRRWFLVPALLQVIGRLIVRNDTPPAEALLEFLSQRLSGFLVAVGQNRSARLLAKLARPIQQARLICVAGKAVDLPDLGPDGPGPAMDAHFLVAVQDMPSQASREPDSRRTESRTHGREMFRLKWCLIRPAVHIPDVDMMMQGCL